MTKYYSQKAAEVLLIACALLALIGLCFGAYVLHQNHMDYKTPILDGLMKANAIIISGSVGGLVLCGIKTKQGKRLFNFIYLNDNYSLIKFFSYLGAWAAVNIVSIKSLSGVTLRDSYLTFETFQLISIYPTILTIATLSYVIISALEVIKIMTEKMQPSRKA